MGRFELTPVIQQILIGCVVLFIGTYLLEGREYFDLNNILAFHYPKNELFKPWQIITHMFMHGGIAHLAFNMFALVSLRVTIEKIVGSKSSLFYFLFQA
ncbi:MAG: rhomboid family intramembrane serine protease [Bacteroidia bacterium]